MSHRQLVVQLLLQLLVCSASSEEAAERLRHHHVDLVLIHHLGRAEEQLLQRFRQNFITCNQHYNNKEVVDARKHRIELDDQHLFEAGDISDPNFVLAKTLRDNVLEMHESGEAYSFLNEGSEEKKLSTDLWNSFSHSAVDSLTSHNPWNFLDPLVSPWVHQGMFSSWPYTFGMEVAYMASSPAWRDVWQWLLTESPVGNPPTCKLEESGITSSSNLVHQTFHLYLYHSVTSKYLWQDTDLIVEFGAGYGCLCLLLHSAGFRGRYLIFDLPVFAQVQTFYLQAHGHEVRMLPQHLPDFLAGVQGVYIALDHHALGDALRVLEEESLRSCFIGMWSLAEAPRESRDPLRLLLPRFSSVMLGFHASWGGIDNDEFLKETREEFETNKSKRKLEVTSFILTLPAEISAKDRYWIATSSTGNSKVQVEL